MSCAVPNQGEKQFDRGHVHEREDQQLRRVEAKISKTACHTSTTKSSTQIEKFTAKFSSVESRRNDLFVRFLDCSRQGLKQLIEKSEKAANWTPL
jgi:hypothetical protein